MHCLKHRPKDYWKIELELGAKDHNYSAIWFDPNFKKLKNSDSIDEGDKKEDRIFEKSDCDKIIEDIEKNKNNTQARETLKESREIAPQLFDLTYCKEKPIVVLVCLPLGLFNLLSDYMKSTNVSHIQEQILNIFLMTIKSM